MGRYFKIIDKNRTAGIIVRREGGLYELIEDIVGDMKNPCNGIPYGIEVEGWADLACEGEIYETKDFIVECLSEEDYEDYENLCR